MREGIRSTIQSLCAIGLFGVAAGGSSFAAEMPSQYQGVWSHFKCLLPVSEADIGEFPFLIVTRDGYEAHEHSCEPRSIEKVDGKHKMTFQCFGEGMEWTKKEFWSTRPHVVDIWGWTLSAQTLIVDGPNGADVAYKKCAFSARRRNN
jgi:hypothetical protein